ncbi:MAG: SDR family NAD(P)-dependent oxidoreductase [Deltaproteobacteria bacterium]|nr:SDR family NAD(P)-dependent oxidoreductase [Deltaproteobacteria bacterium]
MSVHDYVRRRFVSSAYAEPVDLAGKKIIVTGASAGSLGFETARTLAQWGASVVVTTRSNAGAAVEAIQGQLQEAGARQRVDAHALDLSQRDSVISFVRWFVEAHGDSLDVLVNNAGIHLDLLSRWKEPRLTDDGFEIQWRTNYLGTAHLTHLLLPLLEQTGQATSDARIVNVVSHLHVKGSNDDLFGATRPYRSWEAYGNSKLALMHMTNELQRRYAHKSHVQAYCLHPGSVFTNVAGRGLEGTGFIEKARNALSPVEAFFLKTAEEGAQTQIYCASQPRLRGGLYYEECKPGEASKEAANAEIAARLWNETQAWLGA